MTVQQYNGTTIQPEHVCHMTGITTTDLIQMHSSYELTCVTLDHADKTCPSEVWVLYSTLSFMIIKYIFIFYYFYFYLFYLHVCYAIAHYCANKYLN